LAVIFLSLASRAFGFRALPTTSWARKVSALNAETAVSENPPQVFIGNMPFTVTEADLKSLVEEKGVKFESLKIAKDRTTKASRGFGYVNFQSQQEAEEAVSKLSGLAIDGREVKVDLSVPKDQRPPRADGPRRERPPMAPADQSVFIGNLDFSVTDAEILAMCNDILGEGVVSKVRLATDRETGTYETQLPYTPTFLLFFSLFLSFSLCLFVSLSLCLFVSLSLFLTSPPPSLPPSLHVSQLLDIRTPSRFRSPRL